MVGQAPYGRVVVQVGRLERGTEAFGEPVGELGEADGVQAQVVKAAVVVELVHRGLQDVRDDLADRVGQGGTPPVVRHGRLACGGRALSAGLQIRRRLRRQSGGAARA